tara:strand:- start:222 stop:959 length:738 start_codon:yes stop_codon:yes gene_type:complete
MESPAKRFRGGGLAETAAVPEPDGDPLQKFTDLISRDFTDEGLAQFKRLLKDHPELAFTPKVLFDDHIIGEPLKLCSPLTILVLARNFKYIEIMLDSAKTSSSKSADDPDRGLYSKEFRMLVNAVDEYNGQTPLWSAVDDAITFKEKLGMEKESHESILVAKVLLRYLASPIIDALDKHPDESTPLQLIRGYKKRYETTNGEGTFERLDRGKWHKLEAAMDEIFKHVHALRSIPLATKQYLYNLY